MKFLKFFLLVLSFTTATTYAQKPRVFQDLPEYISYVKEAGVNDQKLIVFNKEDYYAFGNYVVDNKLYTFYGIVYKSQFISATQLENKSCWGQFRDLCKNINDQTMGKNIEDISYLKDIAFDPEKKTVLFIYSYFDKQGLKKFIKPVLKEIENDAEFDYIFLSQDTMRIKSLR